MTIHPLPPLSHFDRQTNIQTNRLIDRQIDRQADRLIDRQADRQRHRVVVAVAAVRIGRRETHSLTYLFVNTASHRCGTSVEESLASSSGRVESTAYSLPIEPHIAVTDTSHSLAKSE